MKSKIIITTIAIAVAVATIIGMTTGTLAYARSTSDSLGNQQLLCYAAGGILVLGGVPVTDVLRYGAAAHAAGVCP